MYGILTTFICFAVIACSGSTPLGPFKKSSDKGQTVPGSESPQVTEFSGSTEKSSDPKEGDGTQSPPHDDEDTPASPPMPIAGSFLTSSCEKIDLNPDMPSSRTTTQTQVGCVVLDSQNQVYNGKVRLNHLELYVGQKKQPLKGLPLKKPAESRWHQIFEVKDLGAQTMIQYRIKGTVDGNPLDVYRDASASQFKGPDPDCQKVDIKTDMYSSIMDFRSSTNILNLGQAPVEVFAGTLLDSKDKILLESALGRNIVHGVSLDSTAYSECPKNWYLALTDHANQFVAEYHLFDQRAFTLPKGSFKMWLGYRETQGGFYPSNEGGVLFQGPSPQSTGGCRFKFVHESRACIKQ